MGLTINANLPDPGTGKYTIGRVLDINGVNSRSFFSFGTRVNKCVDTGAMHYGPRLLHRRRTSCNSPGVVLFDVCLILSSLFPPEPPRSYFAVLFWVSTLASLLNTSSVNSSGMALLVFLLPLTRVVRLWTLAGRTADWGAVDVKLEEPSKGHSSPPSLKPWRVHL